MASRLNLHEELCAILGTRNVYFQPPESVKLSYPCIVYSLAGINAIKADDKLYKGTNRYTVTVIDRDPDAQLHVEVLAHFIMCSLDRAYMSDNLYHKTLTLYY